MRLCGSPQRNGPSEARWQVSGLGAECKSCLSGGPPAPRDKDGEGNHRLFEFQVCKPTRFCHRQAYRFGAPEPES